MKQLIYLSSAAKLMTEEELVDILASSRKNNTRNKLTGILLYSGGTFIQVLEGITEQVNVTFERIERDPRHKNIITLIETAIEKRDFPDWSMGFTAVNAESYKELAGYLNNPSSILGNSHGSSAITVLKTFIKTNHLTVAVD